MTASASWLTSLRLRRAGQTLVALPRSPTRWPVAEAVGVAWRRCGGPLDEIESLIHLLADLGLLRLRKGLVVQSRRGERVSALPGAEQARALGTLLMQAGYFNEQARALVELGSIDSSGCLILPRRFARANAPQLVELLALWDSVVTYPAVAIPAPLLVDLGVASSLLPPEGDVPAWVKDRKAVGTRAEMYSVMLLRAEARDPTLIAWVARDSDALGYDVEDRRSLPRRAIEVKGSRGTEVGFNLTAREWEKARELGASYHLHFWGSIDLNTSPLVEYSSLRAAGYPLVYPDLATELDGHQWTITATNWRVSLTV